MQTVLPREEAVEGVISKVLESQEACDRLNEVFYEHLENYQEINDDGDRHFAEVLLQSYKNGDVSALLHTHTSFVISCFSPVKTE